MINDDSVALEHYQNSLIEKEKYANFLGMSGKNIQPGNIVAAPTAVNYSRGRKARLGKNISQVEMFNPETRKHLRDMLEA